MPRLVNQYILNLAGSGNVSIHWGDGQTDSVNLNSAPQPFTHNYAQVGKYLIEISGPGTVTNVNAVGTQSAQLEEIRSFGSIGLESFRHSSQNTEWDSEVRESWLRDVPDSVPNTLKELPGFFAYSTLPPVAKTSSWDWKNFTNLFEFFKEAKQFDFTMRDVVLANLVDISQFALDAEDATFYFDNVKFINPTIVVDSMFAGLKTSELNLHRFECHSQNANRILTSCYRVDANWTDVSFPVATNIRYMAYYCNDLNLSINGFDAPLATDATSAFAQGGSIHGASSQPGSNAGLTITRFNIPNVTLSNSMFSGWSNAKLNINLPDLSKITDIGGMFGFTINCEVNVANLKLRDAVGLGELVAASHTSKFEFNGFEIGGSGGLTNLFYDNTNCIFDINGFTVASNRSLPNAFLASKKCTVNIPNATIGLNTALNGFFSNMSQNSIINANGWSLQGGNSLFQTFSALSSGTQVNANDWIIQGDVEIMKLFGLNRPEFETYVGYREGGSVINATNWIFNGVVKGEDRLSLDASLGLFTGTNNAKINLSGWEFNGPTSLQLGNNVQSSDIDLRNWQFNNSINLTNFAEGFGEGNQSGMYLRLDGWQFTSGQNNVVDGLFYNFAKRVTGLFGDKQNYVTTVTGLPTWPVGVYSSAIGLTTGAGPDVIGLDVSNIN